MKRFLARWARRLGLRRDPSVMWVGHGIVTHFDARLFSHRNVVSRNAFERFLKSRARPFAPVEDALAGRGDALTIDDAIGASYDAAMVARQHGHAVTLYVNPATVVSGRVYWFTRMDAALDATTAQACRFDARDWPLAERRDRDLLRQAVKTAARARPAAADVLMDELVHALGVTGKPIPSEFAPITAAQLGELVRAGVAVGNHGWEHVDTPDAEAQIENVARGRAWLERELGISCPDYCVPFGLIRPAVGTASAPFDSWLLADESVALGHLPGRAFNRRALDSRSIVEA